MTDEQMRQAFRILLDLWKEAKEQQDNYERTNDYMYWLSQTMQEAPSMNDGGFK